MAIGQGRNRRSGRQGDRPSSMQRQPDGHGEAALRSTMSWVALAGTAALLGTLAVVGCGAQGVCQTDGDCGDGARCRTEDKTCQQHVEDATCTPACLEWEYCSEQQCYPRYETITVLEPAAGTVDGGAVVRAQLKTVKSWIGLRQHAKLMYKVRTGNGSTADQGDLSPAGDAGIYAGHLSVAAGSYTLNAGFPNFPSGAPVSADVLITVDTNVPTFTVNPGMKTGLRTGGPGLPDDRDLLQPNAFKRNDVVTVSIGSNDSDLNMNSVTLEVQGVDAGNSTSFAVSSSSGCGQTTCWTATANLAMVEMWALRGQMTLTAKGRDNAGNVGQGSAQIPVTRLKWTRALPSAPATISASPAVGTQGTVYVATNAGGASTLSAIRPDGTDQWLTPVNLGGPFLASPAIGRGNGSEEIIYGMPNVNPPTLYALFGSDGGPAVVPVVPPTTGTVAASPLIALTRASGSDIRESATTFANGSPDYSLVSLRFGSPVSANQLGDGGAVTNPGNIVGEDNIAFAADNTQRIHEYGFSGNWSIAAPDRVTTGTSVGLALTSALVAGSTGGSVFAFPRTTGTPFSRAELSPSIPSFIGSDLIYSEGSSFDAVRTNPSSGARITGNLGVATTTPLVGSGGVTHFVGTDNSVHVLTPGLTKLWSGTAEASVVVASSPNIDCARSSSGTKLSGPGTLYYGANNGKLYAIIVDNPGIDTSSPWPKYQRDPRNTGSLPAGLSEFTCSP